ncbi:MAG TPA: HAD family phosphatase [Terriglobia bacterium]|nr:HAD family phosphatase [Terriglobia bacterium]
MLRAIIFDFDGIIVNSEPLILKITQEMAAQEGWSVTDEEYYREYLAYDDRGIIEHLYRSHGRPIDVQRRDELVGWKARVYAGMIRGGLPPLPGAVEFVRRAALRYPLAIGSGSLRSEIEHLLMTLQLRDAFQVVVTADEVEHSKPEPEVYLKVLDGLRGLPQFRATSTGDGPSPLMAGECLVIEDAPAGIRAAHAAGMKCLALAHSRPAGELQQADWVSLNFAGVDFPAIVAGFDPAGR